MNENTPPLDGLIQIATYWTLNPDHSCSAWVMRPGGKKNEYVVTPDQLRTLHEDMPEALKAMIVNRLQKGEQGVAQQFKVQATLQLLQFGGIKLKDRLDKPYLLSKVTNINRVPGYDNLVAITGTAVTVNHTQHEGRHIDYVVDIKNPVLNVERSVLDESYPGWEKRLTLGVELDVNTVALYRHVFPNKTAPAPLPLAGNLTFE